MLQAQLLSHSLKDRLQGVVVLSAALSFGVCRRTPTNHLL